MLFFSKLSILLTCLVGLVPVMTGAQNIDFENLPAGTVVNAQYAPRGVIFFGAYIETNSNAHSGTRVLRSIPPTAEVFTPGPLLMTFTSPQTRVAFFAGNFPDGIGKGTLKVFDSAGTLVGQDGPKAVPSNSFNAFFEVRSQTPKIVRAEFQIDGSALELIDDLIVEGNVATLPNEPPKVTITNPTEGAVYPEKSVMIRGTVTGDSVLDNIDLQVTMGLPSDSTAPPSVNTVSLSGTGASRTFSLNYGVLTGPYTITAVATNTANLQGTATVHFRSLPVLSPLYDPNFTGRVIVPSNADWDLSGLARIPLRSGVALIGERGPLGARPRLFTNDKAEGYRLIELIGNDVRTNGRERDARQKKCSDHHAAIHSAP